MKLEYIWIEKYNQMSNFEISLSSTNKFKVDDLGYEIKLIHELNRNNLKDFFHIISEDESRNDCVKDIVALVGKNGAGKSTSLDLILEIFMNDMFCRYSHNYIIVISDENNKLTIITTLDNIEITKIKGFQYNVKDRSSLIERKQKDEYDNEELLYYNHYNEDLNKFHVIYYSNSFEARRGIDIFKSYNNKVYDISTMSQLELDNIGESKETDDKSLLQYINTHFIMDIIRQVNFILDVDREERHTKIKIPDFITLIYDDIDTKVKNILSYLDFSVLKSKDKSVGETKLLLGNYYKKLDKELPTIKNVENFKKSLFCSALTIKRFVQFFERRKTHLFGLLNSINVDEYYKNESMKELFIGDLFFNLIIGCLHELSHYPAWIDCNLHVILDELELSLFSVEYINKILLEHTEQDEESIYVLKEEIENSKTILDKITWYSCGNENIESILQSQVNLSKRLILVYLKLLENIDIEEVNKIYSDKIIQKTSKEVDDNVNATYDYLDMSLKNIKINNIEGNNIYKISLYKEYREQLNKVFSELYKIYTSTNMIRFEWNLSTGENNLLNFYGRLNFIKSYMQKKDIIILIDEAETSYHPSWQQDYINSIIELANTVLEGYSVQFVITTHSPLILSDLPDGNVKYLKSQNRNSTQMEKNNNIKKTFGANIYELYNDSFFLKSSEVAGLIGTFANRKIKTLLEKMDIYIHEPDKKSVDRKTLNSILFEAEYIIEIVGDKLIKSIIKDKYSDLRRVYSINEYKSDDKIESFYKNLSKSDKQKLIDIILRDSNDSND